MFDLFMTESLFLVKIINSSYKKEEEKYFKVRRITRRLKSHPSFLSESIELITKTQVGKATGQRLSSSLGSGFPRRRRRKGPQ